MALHLTHQTKDDDDVVVAQTLQLFIQIYTNYYYTLTCILSKILHKISQLNKRSNNNKNIIFVGVVLWVKKSL